MKEIILIIDDAPDDLELLQAILEERGYQVVKAHDGQEGLQKIKEEHPAVVISDVVMPRMNGYEFLKQVRHDDSTSQLPVLIVTARPKMAETFLELGADSFMSKPITGDEFLSEVTKLVNRTKRPQFANKRAVIFGKDEKTLQSMYQQLGELGCAAVAVKEEQQIISVVEEVNPDVFFLAMNIDMKVSADTLVYILNAWAPRRKTLENSRNKTYRPAGKMSIVLFDEAQAPGPAWIDDPTGNYNTSAGDKKALLQKCYANGASEYIGTYSAHTFGAQVQNFLND